MSDPKVTADDKISRVLNIISLLRSENLPPRRLR
jgi:hypothetical protein